MAIVPSRTKLLPIRRTSWLTTDLRSSSTSISPTTIWAATHWGVERQCACWRGGAKPRRAIVAGAGGWDGIVNTAGRGTHFRNILTNLGTFQRGSAEWMAEAFLKTVGGDPVALLHVLDTFVDTPREELARIETPTLVLIGADDHDTGSGEAFGCRASAWDVRWYAG